MRRPCCRLTWGWCWVRHPAYDGGRSRRHPFWGCIRTSGRRCRRRIRGGRRGRGGGRESGRGSGKGSGRGRASRWAGSASDGLALSLCSASRLPRHPASASCLKALVSEYRNTVSIAARSSRPLTFIFPTSLHFFNLVYHQKVSLLRIKYQAISPLFILVSSSFTFS
jgi:hypothetical protein